MADAYRPDYEQQWLFPPSLEDLLPSDHPARFVRDFLRTQDLPALGFAAPTPGPGQPPFAAEVLLGVWLYGHLIRIRSTRRLEAACLDHLGLLWLTGLRAPDHSTLWAFFHQHRAAIRRFFAQIVKVAGQCGLVGLALQAVDGTKLAGACSRHSAWRREPLAKQLAQAAEAAAQAALAEIAAAQATEAGASVRLTGALAEATQRRDAIQAALAALDAAEADTVSPTDPEARMMKLADGGCQLGYNAQAVVDSRHGLLTAVDVVPEASDAHQLVPMLTQAEQQTGGVAEEAVADQGYVSGEQLAAAEAAGYPVLVALGEDPRQDGVGPYHKARFTYDAAQDAYQCPQGRWLPFVRTKWHTQRHYEVRIYRGACRGCPVRAQCTRQQRGGREITRIPHEAEYARQRAKHAVTENRQLLRWRGAVVERRFGDIKAHQGFRRFTVWGLDAVRAQWALVCSALNLQTLYQLWRVGRFRLAPCLCAG